MGDSLDKDMHLSVSASADASWQAPVGMSASDYLAFLVQRRAEILQVVDQCARSCGRDTQDILVEAVSKTVDTQGFRLAIRAGWRAFGENRPQELVRKYACLEADELADIRMDMIGNLQTNKINQVLGRAALIHSISSTHLASAVDKRAANRGERQDVLLEVNISGEESKSGFAPDVLVEELDALLAMDSIRICGLMTMAPAGNADLARKTFSDLRDFRDTLEQRAGIALPQLSCGMSGDFREAVAEGATILRLGRVVFDPSHNLADFRDNNRK